VDWAPADDLCLCYRPQHTWYGSYLPTPHTHVWEQAFGLLRTASVKAHPISPTFPKNPTCKTVFPQMRIILSAEWAPLASTTLSSPWPAGEDPSGRGWPSPHADEGTRQRLRAATAARGRKKKYSSGNPWDHLAPDPDVWWDIMAGEYLNRPIGFKSIAKSPLKWAENCKN